MFVWVLVFVTWLIGGEINELSDLFPLILYYFYFYEV